jgi:threonine dehydrogenase-like Zn-dependent dehydrogenase
MKAIALVPQTTDVSLTDVPEPKITTPNQVKLRVLQVGICGTDREEVSGGRSDAPHGESRLIIGHEMLAEVVDVGAKVKQFAPKDLAVVMVRRPCPTCEMCKKGLSDMCQTGNYKERGIKQLPGFQSEFVVDEENFIVKVPHSLKNLAVLTEPTSVVEKAIDHACRMQVERLALNIEPAKWLHGKRALVAGLGPIGLMAAMVLALRGAHVIGVDVAAPDSLRVKILKALGGQYVQGQAKDLGQIDLIVEAAGIAKLDFDLISLLGVNGIYALTGVSDKCTPFSLEGGSLMRDIVLKNQVIFGSVNASRDHFHQAIVDLEAASHKWKGVIEQVITSKTSYTHFQEVLQKKKADEIKAVIEWHH